MIVHLKDGSFVPGEYEQRVCSGAVQGVDFAGEAELEVEQGGRFQEVGFVAVAPHARVADHEDFVGSVSRGLLLGGSRTALILSEC